MFDGTLKLTCNFEYRYVVLELANGEYAIPKEMT